MLSKYSHVDRTVLKIASVPNNRINLCEGVPCGKQRTSFLRERANVQSIQALENDNLVSNFVPTYERNSCSLSQPDVNLCLSSRPLFNL
jgi:hypothetical protein